MSGLLLERERELEVLDAEVERVLRERRERLVLIGGEAGIGKSELVAAFCARVSQPRSSASAAVRVVSGACDRARQASAARRDPRHRRPSPRRASGRRGV